MTPPPQPGAVFLDHRAKLRRWRAVVAVAAAVGLLVTGGYLALGSLSTPDATVRSYLAALADRDLAAAMRQVAPEVADPVERDLVADPVLASDQYAPPEQVQVVEVRVAGREAVADINYTVASRDRTVSVRLRRDGGFPGGLLRRWLVVDAIGSIRLGEAPAEITVNGRRVPAHDQHGPRILPALPGAYQVAVPADDPVWQEQLVTVDVRPAAATDLDVRVVARPEVRAEVERQLARRLDQCATSAELRPPGCPFGYDRPARADQVRWEVTRYPGVSISPAGTAVAVESTRDGEAVVIGDPPVGQAFRQVVPFSITGTLVVQDGVVEFRPGW